ncbi:MAG: hypothetical protein BZ136_07595 [Methanosphaera sp. rholeuAM74]|nr:MAG: hypothetical protein BZ136_07595 [Methanosphaera sp. rholeuAM74]
MTIKNKNLFNDYLKYEKIIKENSGSQRLDIHNEEFIAPTTLILLLRYVMKNNITDIRLNQKTFLMYQQLLNKNRHLQTLHSQYFRKLDKQLMVNP